MTPLYLQTATALSKASPLCSLNPKYRVGLTHESGFDFRNPAFCRMTIPTTDHVLDFPIDVPEPTITTRLWRFWNVVWLAARVYAGSKATQPSTRLISDRNKVELYLRQCLPAPHALRV